MVHVLLDRIGSWPTVLVLAVAAVVLTLESGVLLGLALPGSTTLVALGLWSSASGTDPVLPAGVAAVASVSGALLGWRHGYRRRAHPTRRLPARVDSVVQRVNGWLARQGPLGSSALLAGAHWVATARTLTPRVAGGAGVPLRLAGPVIAVSGTLWAGTVVLLTQAVGERVIDDASWAPAVVLAVLLVLLVVRAERRSHRSAA